MMLLYIPAMLSLPWLCYIFQPCCHSPDYVIIYSCHVVTLLIMLLYSPAMMSLPWLSYILQPCCPSPDYLIYLSLYSIYSYCIYSCFIFQLCSSSPTWSCCFLWECQSSSLSCLLGNIPVRGPSLAGRWQGSSKVKHLEHKTMDLSLDGDPPILDSNVDSWRSLA